MSMKIGTSNSNRQVISFKNADGTTVGTLSVSKPSKNKKKKQLQYNFKEISSQIMMSKTSGIARQVMIRAQGKVAMLQRKVKNGEYDEKELESALIHAKKMERIARKRMKHLQEEESIKQNQKPDLFELEEEVRPDEANEKKEQEKELSKEELKELMQELQEMLEESMEDMEDLEEDIEDLNELTEELAGASKEDMKPEEFEQLKKKRRSDELKEIIEADMKYLKALFDKLEKEKQENAGGGSSRSADCGVSLEISGMEMPVQMTEASAMPEGGSVDICV